MADRPEDNPRNRLQELLSDRGIPPTDHLSVRSTKVGLQDFVATATVSLPSGAVISAEGEQSRGKKHTERLACQALLDLLHGSHPHLFDDWEPVRIDAQAGDALIKLAAYLANDHDSAAQTSHFLQAHESNASLSEVYDRWQAEDRVGLRDWGTDLSQARKGTLVEALIWREYGGRILSEGARGELGRIRAVLTRGVVAQDTRQPR